MQPTNFEGSRNFIPTLSNGDYQPGRIIVDERDNPKTITAWELTDEDLAKLAETKILYVVQAGEGVAPFTLTTEKPFETETTEQ
jgi:hypothetical protein